MMLPLDGLMYFGYLLDLTSRTRKHSESPTTTKASGDDIIVVENRRSITCGVETVHFDVMFTIR